MAIMSNYCRAYPASLFREYPGWQERVAALVSSDAGPQDDAEELPRDEVDREGHEYYFLHDNYIVTAGVFVDQDIAFEDRSDAWKQFCEERLKFEVPADVREP